MSEAATAPPQKTKRPRPEKTKAKAPRWYFTAEHLADIPANDPARPFCEIIAEKPEEHNRFVHLAARRQALDHKLSAGPDRPYVFDAKKAARPIAFCRQFRAFEGPLVGSEFALLAWQRFIVACLYGWRKRADPRKRRFNYGYNEVAKKNGKTPLVAPLGLYQVAYPPPGSRCEVYSIATALDQAKLTWKDGLRMLRTSSPWAKQFRERVNKLVHGPSDSEWRPLGGDKSTLDGLRPELAIMDELHAWTDPGLWGIINAAFGAAFSPLILQITTAGDDVAGVCREQRDRVERILDAVERGTYRGLPEGAGADEGFYFGIIFTIDKGDPWDDETKWVKANPSLGVVKSLEDMRKLASGARASATARRDFMEKQLNIWQSAGFESWVEIEIWDRCHVLTEPRPADAWERLKGLRAWFGLDPSSRRDITALCAIADDPDDDEALLVAWDFWVPGGNIVERVTAEGLPYDLWQREGWVNFTEGSAIDINEIKRRCITRRAEVDLAMMGFDEGSSQGIGIALHNDESFPIVSVPQGYRLSPALQELERRVLAGKIRHFGNPVAAAQFSRAKVMQGDTQIRLVKGKSKGRIDGIAALAMAIAARQHDLAQGPQGGGIAVV